MKRTISLLSIPILLLSVNVHIAEAQDVWKGGSVYSHYALGMPHDYRASFADGMGVYGVAIHDSRIPNMANPAAWSRAVFTNASGVFEIISYEASHEGIQSSSTQYQTGPFQVVMPVTRDRIGISLSFSPLTASRFRVQNEYQLEPNENHTGNLLRYAIENRGSGGINKIEAGIGYRISRSLSLGYAPSLLLGSFNRTQTVFFDNADYRPVNLTEATTHYGFGNRFGLYYMQRNFLRQNDRMIIGATVSLPVNFKSERELKSRIDLNDVVIRPASEYGDGNATFPLEASFGFSYNPNPFFQISSDVLYQNWGDHTNFSGQREAFLKDRFRVGLGGQLVASRSEASSFFSNFIYRLGVSYDTGNLTFNGNDLETYTIHAGIGIPSARSGSSIDINAEYGFRGMQADDLISERIFSVKVSFNLSELMFIQRRLQ